MMEQWQAAEKHQRPGFGGTAQQQLRLASDNGQVAVGERDHLGRARGTARVEVARRVGGGNGAAGEEAVGALSGQLLSKIHRTLVGRAGLGCIVRSAFTSKRWGNDR